MVRSEDSLETPSFCNLALRPSIPLILKFCFRQEDEFLPLDFLRDPSSRLIKLVIVSHCFWVQQLRWPSWSYKYYHRYFVFQDFAQNLWDQWGENIKTLAESILLEGICCKAQSIRLLRKVSLDLLR